MSPTRCEQFLQRTELLMRMFDGDCAPYVAECVKDEIRRVLRYVEPAIEPSVIKLAEADE